MKVYSFQFFLLFIASCLLIARAGFLRAQVITIVPGKNETLILSNTYAALEIQNTLTSIEFFKIKTSSGDFIRLSINDYGVTQDVGEPLLPVLGKLIEIPVNATYQVEVLHTQFKDISLEDFGITQKLIPAQPSRVKSDAANNEFVLNQEVYQMDTFLGNELVSLNEVGILRGLRLGRLEIAPVYYNPVRNIIRVYHYLEFRVKFIHSDPERTLSLKRKLNPFFFPVKSFVFNFREPEARQGWFDNEPITYIIVSDPMFRVALQPFIQWKQKKGFRVVEAYTDDPLVGNTPSGIRNFLRNFYENPPEGCQPQTFILLVGDVAQIPSFNGSTGNHATDLYYAEYTNDILPDAIYGRFSATTVQQLEPQIQKTLMYEQFTFDHPEYLNQVILVAGQDAQHQLLWGNGQVNYLSNHYFNESNGIVSHNYLQPEPPGANYSLSIRQKISEGAALVNYTAHCSASGWANPSFNINHISALQNYGKYPLIVGNCCSSADFRINSFAEELLRAADKGAVGYIGGSNNTYWNEDFWWAVGFKTITASPVFDPGALGAFDRLWPAVSGVDLPDWYVAQGQMTVAGNLAVTQSGSYLTSYYWEIYHLLGDPSLMPFLSQPGETSAVYPGLLPLGANTFTIHTLPFAYAAISMNSELLGAGFSDAQGVAEVTLFNPPMFPGIAEVTITGPQLKPWSGTITVASPDGPYVLVVSVAVDDGTTGNGNLRMDYGESVKFRLTLKNYGQQPGNNILLELSSSSQYVEIPGATYELSHIGSGEEITVSGIFYIVVSPHVPDGQWINFTLSATDGSSVWISTFGLKAHAPAFTFAGILINEDNGNGNGKIEAGEQATLTVFIQNSGNSKAFDLTGQLIHINPYVTVSNPTLKVFGDVDYGQLTSADFHITASLETPPGFQADFLLKLFASEQLEFSVTFSITAGLIPVLVIDLDKNGNSAHAIIEAVNHLGIYADIKNTIPEDLNLYSSVFVTLGIYNANHVLTPQQGQRLAQYLQSGGKLYMEGGDTWFYDPPTAVHPLFGITGISDGAGDLDTISGIPGTFTEGIKIKYFGENNWIDRLQPHSGAIIVLRNNYPAYACGIARIGNGFKTIGTSFEFGGLQHDTTRFALMKAYLEFFEITIPGVLSSNAFALDPFICQGDTTRLIVNTSGGSGNFSFLWSPAEGLSDPGSPTPYAFPSSTTTYSVEVRDNLTGNTVSESVTIQVKEKPPVPVITQVGQILVSNSVTGNQWYNDDGPIEGARLQVFIPTKTGNYYTIVTHANGCPSDKSNVIFFQSTFIDEIVPTEAIRVYPNPTNGIVHIDFPIEMGVNPNFVLVNSFGQILNDRVVALLKRTSNNTLTLDLTKLPSGVYYLKMIADNQFFIRKILLGK